MIVCMQRIRVGAGRESDEKLGIVDEDGLENAACEGKSKVVERGFEECWVGDY